MQTNQSSARDVIFEFIQLGNCIKVIAIDVTTGLEVSTMGPKTATQKHLQQTALAKLNYVLNRDQ